MASRLLRSPITHRSPIAKRSIATLGKLTSRASTLGGAVLSLRPVFGSKNIGRRAVSRVATAVASAAVLAFALLYVIAPASSAMTIKDRYGGYAPAGSVVIYGTVTNGSGPVEGAVITVYGSPSYEGGGGRGRIVAEESTNSQGTYRLQLYVSPGTYTVDVSLDNGSVHRDYNVHVADAGSLAGTGYQASQLRTGGVGAYDLLAANWGARYSGTANHHHRGRGLQLDSYSGVPEHNGRGGNGDQGSLNALGSGGGQGSGDVQNSSGYPTRSSYPGDQEGFPPGNHFGLLSAQQSLMLVPGVSYDVSVQVTTGNLLSFLPVSSY